MKPERKDYMTPGKREQLRQQLAADVAAFKGEIIQLPPSPVVHMGDWKEARVQYTFTEEDETV